MFPEHARVPCRTAKKYLKLVRISDGEIVRCVVFKKDYGEIATPSAKRHERIVHIVVMQPIVQRMDHRKTANQAAFPAAQHLGHFLFPPLQFIDERREFFRGMIQLCARMKGYRPIPAIHLHLMGHVQAGNPPPGGKRQLPIQAQPIVQVAARIQAMIHQFGFV